MDKLVLATTNQHKIEEFRLFLANHKIQILSLSDFAPVQAPEENGTSFLQNAELKAKYYADKFNMPVLSDDSGIVVKSLKGEPGVRSARYAGEKADGVENNKLLMKNLQNTADRSAYFQCVLALCLPKEKRLVFFIGKCYGKIINEYNGEKGFGYDPIFKPDGREETFSKINSVEKNLISHRGIALRGFDKFLKSTF